MKNKTKQKQTAKKIDFLCQMLKNASNTSINLMYFVKIKALYLKKSKLIDLH